MTMLGTSVQFVRPLDVEVGDVVIVEITARNFNATTSIPAGWQPLFDDVDTLQECGTSRRRTTIAAGVAADETSYDFEFSQQSSIAATLVAYGNAAAPQTRRTEAISNGTAPPMDLVFGGFELSAGSVMVLGANCANDCGDDLSETEALVSADMETIMFEAAVVETTVPEIAVTIPSNSCAHFAEIVLEPDL